jgi:hypothetical protein
MAISYGLFLSFLTSRVVYRPFWLRWMGVLSFLLEGHTKNAITKAPPVHRVKGGAGLLFVQIHKTEAPAPPRHYVRSQADRSDSTKLREQPIQTLHGRTRGQILHHHFRHNILILEFEN